MGHVRGNLPEVMIVRLAHTYLSAILTKTLVCGKKKSYMDTKIIVAKVTILDRGYQEALRTGSYLVFICGSFRFLTVDLAKHLYLHKSNLWIDISGMPSLEVAYWDHWTMCRF